LPPVETPPVPADVVLVVVAPPRPKEDPAVPVPPELVCVEPPALVVPAEDVVSEAPVEPPSCDCVPVVPALPPVPDLLDSPPTPVLPPLATGQTMLGCSFFTQATCCSLQT